jgi:glycerol kinase
VTQYVGAIDQGTTSTRFLVVDDSSQIVASAQMEHQQILPRPGWVEHDPLEILGNTETVIATALADAGLLASDLVGVGITNQRETTVMWDRATGQPVGNAIVWQDTRTADICSEIGQSVGEGHIRHRTGLPVATYFSAPKILWMLRNDPELVGRARNGEIAVGTIDSWLAWNLTGRHVTDVTNASRTMLMDIRTLAWDDDLSEAMAIPKALLPTIVPSISNLGPCTGVLDGTFLRSILGDQHAAMVGQAAFNDGDSKCTYGTGAFLLTNTGTAPVFSSAGLLTTVAYQREGNAARYALEGSVAVAGSSVQWFRDNLGMIDHSAAIEPLASSVSDNGDVYFVPAFSGLFAPRWRSDARGIFAGMTRYTTRGHLARAVLEATAFQVRDLIDAMRKDTGVSMGEIRVDGGMVANDLLMQFQADILGMDVVVPAVIETTAMGAAFGAGIDGGLWADANDVRNHWHEQNRFRPTLGVSERTKLLAGWNKAVDRSLGWVEGQSSQ